MTIVSVADACRHLDIDAKTLRRWLEDAQLPLQNHPRDGRKKGVSHEHLDLLARLHHRRLALPSEEPPPPVPAFQPPLPVALLTLPEVVCALQAQITALQQQVTELASRLTPQLSRPDSSPSPAPEIRPAKRPPHPAPAAPHPRSVASATPQTPRKPVHVIPRVEYSKEGRYVVICPKRGVLPFEPDTPEWFAWVTKQSSFRFVGKEGHFTAHHEWTTPRGAWRAHRQIRNHSYNLRLAPNQHLTIPVLEQAAQALQVLLQ
jgi:hypothetical protein